MILSFTDLSVSRFSKTYCNLSLFLRQVSERFFRENRYLLYQLHFQTVFLMVLLTDSRAFFKGPTLPPISTVIPAILEAISSPSSPLINLSVILLL